MGLIKEFKEFAVRGNVVDMAVGVIIGGAFGKIVTSLVEDMIMPLIGVVIGGVDFTSLVLNVRGVDVAYGNFIQQVFNFLVIAFSIFIVIKGINSMKKKEEEVEPVPPEPTKEEVLLTEIRDLLKQK
ncbi:large-conductance mechanosensitive channel protein MscL [Filifactor alocis]|uniref:large-conductance mechanosensitive channel protein MscL n=1 Tax=Filifactor alocis TaxID=143361 RepID=UPI0028D63326|nr:large-conductance mechanosensitive channel protein MscL [Filifactor alocis]